MTVCLLRAFSIDAMSYQGQRTPYLKHSPRKHTDPLGGTVGLTNLGNTCFINTGLQCLGHLEHLVEYFLQEAYLKDVAIRSRNEPMQLLTGMTTPWSRGELADSFKRLQEGLWLGKGEKAFDPSRFVEKLKPLAPHLFEGTQEDAREFLHLCFDALSTAVSRIPAGVVVARTAAQPDNVDLGDLETRAALAWSWHLETEKSFLVDLFQGQELQVMECLTCHNASRRFEVFKYLTLPVNPRLRSLEEVLKAYTDPEYLEGSDAYYCPHCKGKRRATKKNDLWKLPPVLAVCLNRATWDRQTGQASKLQHLVEARDSPLDLSAFCSSKQKYGATYQLTCIVNHHGSSMHSGHYTATCRVGLNGPWHHFNDAEVRRLWENEKPVTCEAYILFLTRLEVRGNWDIRHPIYAPVAQSLAAPELWPHNASARNSLVVDIREALRTSSNSCTERPSGGGAGTGRATSTPASVRVPSPNAGRGTEASQQRGASPIRQAPQQRTTKERQSTACGATWPVTSNGQAPGQEQNQTRQQPFQPPPRQNGVAPISPRQQQRQRQTGKSQQEDARCLFPHRFQQEHQAKSDKTRSATPQRRATPQGTCTSVGRAGSHANGTPPRELPAPSTDSPMMTAKSAAHSPQDTWLRLCGGQDERADHLPGPNTLRQAAAAAGRCGTPPRHRREEAAAGRFGTSPRHHREEERADRVPGLNTPRHGAAVAGRSGTSPRYPRKEEERTDRVPGPNTPGHAAGAACRSGTPPRREEVSPLTPSLRRQPSPAAAHGAAGPSTGSHGIHAPRAGNTLTHGWLRLRGSCDDWTKLWCELRPGRLELFSDETCHDKKMCLVLHSCSQAISFSAVGAPGDARKCGAAGRHGFVLDPQPSAGPARRLFYFDARTEEIVRHWTGAIRESAAAAPSWEQRMGR